VCLGQVTMQFTCPLNDIDEANWTCHQWALEPQWSTLGVQAAAGRVRPGQMPSALRGAYLQSVSGDFDVHCQVCGVKDNLIDEDPTPGHVEVEVTWGPNTYQGEVNETFVQSYAIFQVDAERGQVCSAGTSHDVEKLTYVDLQKALIVVNKSLDQAVAPKGTASACMCRKDVYSTNLSWLMPNGTSAVRLMVSPVMTTGEVLPLGLITGILKDAVNATTTTTASTTATTIATTTAITGPHVKIEMTLSNVEYQILVSNATLMKRVNACIKATARKFSSEFQDAQIEVDLSQGSLRVVINIFLKLATAVDLIVQRLQPSASNIGKDIASAVSSLPGIEGFASGEIVASGISIKSQGGNPTPAPSSRTSTTPATPGSTSSTSTAPASSQVGMLIVLSIVVVTLFLCCAVTSAALLQKFWRKHPPQMNMTVFDVEELADIRRRWMAPKRTTAPELLIPPLELTLSNGCCSEWDSGPAPADEPVFPVYFDGNVEYFPRKHLCRYINAIGADHIPPVWEDPGTSSSIHHLDQGFAVPSSNVTDQAGRCGCFTQ